MKRAALLFFLLLCVQIGASEGVIAPTRNLLPTHALAPGYVPKVSVVSGEYCEEELDYEVAGCEPLSFRRFYNHQNPPDYRYGAWRVNPENVLVANFEKKCEAPHFASIGDESGALFFLNKGSEISIPNPNYRMKGDTIKAGRYILDPSNDLGYTNLSSEGVSAAADPRNIAITYWKVNDTKAKDRFEWEGYVKDGSGRVREFRSPMFRWHRMKTVELKKGRDFLSKILPENKKYMLISVMSWTPYEIPIYTDRLPNGNIIRYEYTRWREDKDWPKPYLLRRITAFDRTGEKKLGEIQVDYEKYIWRYVHPHRSGEPRYKINMEEVLNYWVEGSDKRPKCEFRNNKRNSVDKFILLQSAQTALGETKYNYQGCNLREVDKGDGRKFITDYDGCNRVSVQYAPIGPKGEMHPLARFDYQDKKTVVTNAEGHASVYHFDDKKRINLIEKPHSRERNVWDGKGRLEESRIEDKDGTIYRKTSYKYDERGNPLEETLEGAGSPAYRLQRTYSNDGYNLKLSETDGLGTTSIFTYEPDSNRLSTEFIRDDKKILKRTFYTYDSAAVCTKKIIDDGLSQDPNDLTGVTYRRITYIRPREKLPCYGLPEEVEERTINEQGEEILLGKVRYAYHPSGKIEKEEHFDDQGNFSYAILNRYDAHDRLTFTQDPLGNQTHYFYDRHHNLIRQEGPRSDQRIDWNYDLANRPIEQNERQSDGSSLISKTSYDRLGRIIAKTDSCGNSTCFEYDSSDRLIATIHPDGAIERKEYDPLGNVTKEVDGKGFVTIKSYDYRGSPLLIIYPDGSREAFTYNANGTLATHIDKNGAKTEYAYDLLNNLIGTKVCEDNEILKATTAAYTPFCKTSETNGVGVTTFYTYDYAGRKLSETKGPSQTYYAYDSLGRVAFFQKGDLVSAFKYDLLDRIVQKTVKDTADNIFRLEQDGYDAAGNHILHIDGEAIWTLEYNAQGKPTLKIDPLGNKTAYLHFYGSEYMLQEVDPHGTVKERHYDARAREYCTLVKNNHGEEIQKQERFFDKNGNCIEEIHTLFEGLKPTGSISNKWIYGPLNRIEALIESDSRTTRYSYDSKGRLAAIHKPNETLFQEHDSLGRLVRAYASDFDYRYAYDGENQLLCVHDTVSNTKTTRSYDALGNVTSETLATGITFVSNFDEYSRRTALLLPNKQTISYSYFGPDLYQITKDNALYTYASRNINGRPVEILLPSSQGIAHMSWDPLNRLQSFSSPNYTGTLSYDEVGNLATYSYQDPLGSKTEEYSYDPLHQLCSDPYHSYKSDSMYNRKALDKTPWEVNFLSEITHDGMHNFYYDPNGNLIDDGESQYTYDSQDRLIAVKKGNTTFTYKYDPFHRRLAKITRKNNSLISTQYYLWDGKNEIGMANQSGEIKELRILGEGFGAEIGAAVILELNGKKYLPIHDHRGSLATLTELQAKKTETYRYTPFGEQLTKTGSSPWRFSGKRLDPETNFYYFGRRYYSPYLGRFITTDPQGFSDGPNLYAYLHNCPLTGFDLYGLRATFNPSPWGLGPSLYSYARDTFYERGWYSSRNYDLPSARQRNFARGRIGFINGQANKLHHAYDKAERISQMAGGVNIDLSYNATHGLPIDTLESYMLLKTNIQTPTSRLLRENWNNFFKSAPADSHYLQICHSGGSFPLRRGLENSPQEIRDRIIVIAIAPACYIPKNLCGKVTHYFSRDFVPLFDWDGLIKNIDTVKFVRPHQDAKLWDHDFDSPTYEKHLFKDIQKFKRRIGEE